MIEVDERKKPAWAKDVKGLIALGELKNKKAVAKRLVKWINEQDTGVQAFYSEVNWGGYKAPTVSWEGGPYEWTWDLTGWGWLTGNGWFAEPYTSWELSIYDR